MANGADAVYFGLSDFNARHRATNFTLDEVETVFRYLHDHNVRGYVTCNTLIFSEELPQIVEYISTLARAGADAVIVQDLGLVRLIRRLAPHLVVHGSTQMTLTEARGIEFVRQLGVERVIVARELSRNDIAQIAARTTMPLEVFVHGALCVAYSGQCLTSESLGGRSANRGQCAQACRLPYELIVDGEQRDLGEQAYLLSPQDLAAPDLIEDLVRLGVACFKIEGRLKSAHYVAATTQTYRSALDAALNQQPFALSRQQELDLAQSFSRGFTHGFLDGVDHQTLVHGRFPKSRGVKIGVVTARTAHGLIVEIDRKFADADELPVKPGDGVVFDEGHPEQDEQGGRVFTVRPHRDSSRAASRQSSRARQSPSCELTFAPGDINIAAVTIGSLVWKTDDPAMRRRLETSFSRDVIPHRVPLDVGVFAAVDQPLRLTFTDTATQHTVEVESDQPLARAERHPLTHELLRTQLSRLGDTPFELGTLRLAGPEGEIAPEGQIPVMVPKSVLNELRRQAVDRLLELRARKKSAAVLHPAALDELRAEALAISQGDSRPASLSPAVEASSGPTEVTDSAADETQLTVLVRSLEQLSAVLEWSSADSLPRPAVVYCDFEDVRRYEEAVRRGRDAGIPIALATLRITKPKEDGWLRQIGRAAPDYVLIRNLAALSFYREYFPELPQLGDYSLNVANELTAALFIESGISRLVPSYDLNWQQLQAMLGKFSPRRFEAVVHQHMPMFHMEHCVFAATLSNGKDYRDCGRPCDHHRVDLRDRMGEPHPLIADVGCRNTVFNASAQSAAEYIPRMKQLGLRWFRVELLRETSAEVAPLLDRYARVLAGLEDGRRTWTQLRVLNQLGVTRGTMGFE